VINKIPFFGWFLSIVAAIGLAVPFWFCWTVFGLGPKYFYWLPAVYQSIPFWDAVGLFIVISIVKGTLTPKFARVSNTTTTQVEAKKEEA